MEMRQIRYFMAVAKSMSFTQAAMICGTTQPAVSQGVKQLEMVLGENLLSREGKRVLLTEFGRRLVPYFERILADVEIIKSVAADFQTLARVSVRLGVLPTIGLGQLSRFFQDFQTEHAGIEISVTSASRSDLFEKLRTNQIDFAITTSEIEGLEEYNRIELYKEGYVVVFPASHPFASQRSLKISEVAPDPYVEWLSGELRDKLTPLLEANSGSRGSRIFSDREEWIQTMVQFGDSHTILPEYSVSMSELQTRPISDFPNKRSVCLLHVASRKFDHAASVFVTAIRKFDWPVAGAVDDLDEN